ncbi:MAG TPA: methyltransferase [Gammaproteobacteria bacterium]|jgi:hypothetical protein|nr:methyltransferase [Gammaproteobacteria bacterium]
MLARLLYGYKMTQCLYVAAKLDIADHLSSGTKSIDQLAVLTNSQLEPLYRVMRCLVSLGIFSEDGERRFAMNPAADDLRGDADNTIKDFVVLCGEELYQSAGDLLYSVKTGKPAFNHIYGMSHWEYLEKNPDKAKIFHDAMERGSIPMIHAIIKHYDFSPFKKIVDIGGGKGHLLCEILKQYPNAVGDVFDLPNAKEHAIEYINQSNLADRCNANSGDFLQSVPAGDLYLLKVVLHDWDDVHAKIILKNCRKSINKSGRLLIIEKVISNDNNRDLACLGDINMLVTLTGKERSLDEFARLLEESGFKFSRSIKTSLSLSIIEALPA